MTQESKNAFPPPSFPKDHVIAVVDTVEEAEQAVQALQQAGYSADRIHLFHSQDFVNSLETTQQQASGLTKLLHTFQGSTDEGFAANMYLEEARRGHNVLVVHEPKADQAGRVRDILVTYHARLIKYFSTWAVTDLR